MPGLLSGRKRAGIALGVTLAATLACASPLQGLVPGSGGLVTADPLSSATPTPFGPIPPTGAPPPTATATATPLATPTTVNPWGYFPGPREASSTQVPREAPRIPVGPHVVNLVFLGSDQRPDSYGFRTDVMMIVSLDSEKGTATLISIPRDLYVFQPGWRVDRINTADPRGGPDLVAITLLYNFGVEIHHFVRVNFSGFTSAVDSLGGIDVQVGRAMSDKCGSTRYAYVPGVYHMDGWTALCYVRMRKASSDFDRLRRQQEVVLAIFSRLITLDGLRRVPEMFGQMQGRVQTDVTLSELVEWVPLAERLASDPTRIRRFAIDTSMADAWRTPSGAAVQLPVRDAILAMLATAFGP
ncbi:MAG: LCP family protein [Anaerolineales bacterium]